MVGTDFPQPQLNRTDHVIGDHERDVEMVCLHRITGGYIDHPVAIATFAANSADLSA